MWLILFILYLVIWYGEQRQRPKFIVQETDWARRRWDPDGTVWGMGPSLTSRQRQSSLQWSWVIECSYVVPGKNLFFFFKYRVWFGVTPLPGLAKDHTFHVKFSVQHSLCKPAFATLTLKADLLWSRRTGLLAFSETVKLRFQDSEFHNQLQRDFHG